jgi:anti-sigma regulatory factor (Ser/Thr protein kinase)
MKPGHRSRADDPGPTGPGSGPAVWARGFGRPKFGNHTYMSRTRQGVRSRKRQAPTPGRQDEVRDGRGRYEDVRSRLRRPGGTGAPAADAWLRRSFRAEPTAAAIAREDIAALALRYGATAAQADDVRLVASEAITNAVRHAYPRERGAVHAMAAVSAGRLTILVSDDGVGPRNESQSPGGGWGWPLISALSEQFTIRRRSNGGTEVEVDLRIGPDPGSPPHERRGSDSSASAPPTPRFSTTT